MGENSGKRSAGGFGFSKRGSSLSFREPNHKDGRVKRCNRLGCSTRLNYMQGTELSTPEKPRNLRTSLRSMSSKSAGGSSSKPFAAPTDLRKSHQQRLNRASSQDTAESSRSRHKVAEEADSSSQRGDTESSDFYPMVTGVQTVLPDSVDLESPTAQRLSTLSTEPSGSKPRTRINQRVGSNRQDVPSISSSVRRPIATKSTGQVIKPPSQDLGNGPPKRGLKDPGCSSISDVLPSGCSSSSHVQSKRGASVRKRLSDGESSSSRVKSSSGSSTSSISRQSGSLMPQQAPRRARNQPLSRDGPVSVRTRGASSWGTRTGLPERQADDNLWVTEPPRYPQWIIDDIVSENPPRSFPMEPPPPIFPNYFGGRPSSSRRSAQSRWVSSPLEDSSNRELLGDTDGYRSFNAEGIAEVGF